MGAGFGAVALSAMGGTQVRGTATALADPLNPFTPRSPRFQPRARSVIFLFLVFRPSGLFGQNWD